MNAASLLPVLFVVAAADPRVVEAQQLAAHGETASARGQYEAILHDLEASGADGSAALHYDIGTLALVDDDVGAAMLHLLAAQRRDPGNDDVAHNLARAKDARQDRVEATAATSLSSLAMHLPPRGVRVFAAVALAALGLALALRGALGARCPPSLFVAAGVVATSAVGAWAARASFDRRALVVVMDATTARSSPDDKADGFDVHPGLAGERVDETAGWWRVRLENGLDVWVASSAAKLVP